MPIAVTCRCGRCLKARDELAGKKVRCPDCAEVLVIPSRASSEGKQSHGQTSAFRPNAPSSKSAALAPSETDANQSLNPQLGGLSDDLFGYATPQTLPNWGDAAQIPGT